MLRHMPRGEHHPGEKVQPEEAVWGAEAVQTNNHKW